MVGICSYGEYVPRYRLDRGLIFQQVGWMGSGSAAHAKGERSVANFDEDSLTMAVAAGLRALHGVDRSRIDGLHLASTTMPYRERLNAAIAATAFGFREDVRAADFANAGKAGTSALLSGLDIVAAGHGDRVLVCASDCRLALPASSLEMLYGDAAVAFVVGRENVAVQFKGAFSTTCDFVDQYRGQRALYTRSWEERWIREAGYQRLLPDAIMGFLSKYGLNIEIFAKVVYDCPYPPARREINALLGLASNAVQDDLQADVGHSGTANVLLMLARALEESKPGDNILVASFGGGCDVIWLAVTDHIHAIKSGSGVSETLSAREPLEPYTKYLVWREFLPVDEGLRAEEDEWTRWSLSWRKRREVLGLWGSCCRRCATVQYPAQRVCVNPVCGAVDEMDPYCFAGKAGHIRSYTGDMLAASPNPPAVYGQIEFEGGGKHLFDITDCNLDELATGMRVSMSFRRRYYDRKRDIAGYFWKAVPCKEEV